MQKDNQNPPKEAIKLHAFSHQYLHYKSNLLDTLKQYHKSTLIPDIYLTEKCYALTLTQRITQVEMFGCGFKKIYHKKNISPYLKLQKIIIISNIDSKSINQLQQIGYLFPEIYLLTLQTTNSQNAQIMRKTQLKKSIKSIKELNLNFFTFLDGLHYISKMEKSWLFKNEQEQKLSYKYERPSKRQKISAYRSFLLAFSKLYQFQVHFLKTSNHQYNYFVNDLEQELLECLGVMQSHENQCKNLDKVSSPKIKCLILNRQVIQDMISPLVYGYFYGPLCEQFINRDKLIEGAQKLASKGKMYNELFDKDFDQASQYIQKLTNDKTVLEGPFQTNYFYKAKHIIASYEDPSPIELSLHISCWKQTRQYGEYRLKTAVLQQDIANRVDEYQRKISNGNCISMIKEWILQTSGEQAEHITEDELLKLGMITQITGDLWFFHHNSIKKLLNDPQRKSRYDNFLSRRKSQIPAHQLKEKPQTSDRSQLYRHQPKLVQIAQKWIDSILNDKNNKKQQEAQKIKENGSNRRESNEIHFDKKLINNDIMRNRQTKLVLLIDGIVGFNQLALLRRMIKGKTDKAVTILAESFCNTQQYSDYLMRPLRNNPRHKSN